MNYFVTAIGTDSGKTIVSAILCEALGADYWKPVQAGYPTDTETMEELVSNPAVRFHPEKYLLKTPASPHAAAKVDGIRIELENFSLPSTHNTLIVEGAGGCMVPLNNHHFVIDLALHLNMPVVLVSDLYLGSINHTLLTFEALQRRGVRMKGLVFNGIPNAESERIILHHTKLPVILRIDREEIMNKPTIKRYAEKLKRAHYGGLA